MYKVLLIGEGGREAAIAKSLHESGAKLYSFMSFKNAGIARISEKFYIGSLLDFESAYKFAKENNVDFAISGPEAPLVHGIADYFEDRGIPFVGPRREVAMIEGSKSFARELMRKYKINAYPEFKIALSLEECEKAIEEIKDYVIKPDGLTGGKGVKVLGEHFFNKEEAIKYCEQILPLHKKIVIEERVEGEEFVLQCFYDGKTLVPMPLVQDHKRALDDDKGENTGGMGSISHKSHLLPFISEAVLDRSLRILKETMLALEKEKGLKYKGIIYGQFMLTRKGPLIIEYNVRFGDPEAINVLSLLRSNFLEICYNIIEGNLSEKKIDFEKLSTVCVYLVPRGYPSNPMKDMIVEVQEDKIKELGVELYYASLKEIGNKLYTTGSRSLALLAKSEEIQEASKLCYKATAYVKGELFYRRDIGTEKLINKRIENLKRLGIL
jgi:phosphoribosylamine--glycine ligase